MTLEELEKIFEWLEKNINTTGKFIFKLSTSKIDIYDKDDTYVGNIKVQYLVQELNLM